MKTLIEDYKRRLTTVNQLLDTSVNNGSISAERKHERLITKAAEYRTFIAEMERLISNPYITSKLNNITGNSIVREFPTVTPTKEWAGAVIDLLDALELTK